MGKHSETSASAAHKRRDLYNQKWRGKEPSTFVYNPEQGASTSHAKQVGSVAARAFNLLSKSDTEPKTLRSRKFAKAVVAIGGALTISTGIAHVAEAAPVVSGKSVIEPATPNTYTQFSAGRQDNEQERLKKVAPLIGDSNAEVNTYTEKIFPLDDERMDSSVRGGVKSGLKKLKAAMGGKRGENNNPKKKERIAGYSEGSVVATRIAIQKPNSELITIGGPGTRETGLAYHPAAEALDPVLKGVLGINLQDSKVPQRPGGKIGDADISEVTHIRTTGDVYASGGMNTLNPAGTLNQVADTLQGDAHTVYGSESLNDPRTYAETIGNTTIITVPDNGVNGYGEVAKKNGFKWSPEANALTNLVGGISADGMRGEAVNPAKVADATLNLVESTAKGYNVHLTLPGPKK